LALSTMLAVNAAECTIDLFLRFAQLFELGPIDVDGAVTCGRMPCAYFCLAASDLGCEWSN
jgi:hypothetical protein